VERRKGVATNDPDNASQPEEDVISFEWCSELGEPGEDDDAGNPFHRSLNHLFETGRPFKTLAFSFVVAESVFRWFGVFVEGKHVVFFPPFSEAYDSAEVGKDGAISTRSFDLDHLTLDLSRRNWHVTSANRTDYIRARPLHEVGDGRALWFGMSFNDSGRLRRLAKITSCRFTAPPSDSARRREIVRRAREGINFPLMYIPDNPDIGEACFMRFISRRRAWVFQLLRRGPRFPAGQFACACLPTRLCALAQPNLPTVVVQR
jgi:hypothetical protein